MTGHGQAVSQGGCQVSSAPLIVGLLVFLPAGTLDYWQAWLFAAVFVGCSLAITVYLAIVDPKLLESRMNAGPGVEKEPSQKIIIMFALAEQRDEVASPHGRPSSGIGRTLPHRCARTPLCITA
jgi:hypothetical protein